MKINIIPSKSERVDSNNRIKKFIHKTPVLTSSLINKTTGAELFFKCENFQKVGAFKFRGASNAVLSLTHEELKAGVVTHSSGNHAAALSLAAKTFNSKAYIVMPRTAPRVKVNAVKTYEGNITFCEPTLKDRETTCKKIMDETGATLIHPYDNYDIIAGAASCGKEIIEEIPGLDFIVSPVGGGGLLSGTSLSAKYFGKNIKVLGAEPEGADDAFRSFKDGKIYPSVNPDTIADGLLTNLSDKTFDIITNYVDEILTVSDTILREAMKMIWERMKIVVEPSGAIGLAVVMKNKEKFRNKRVSIILSGGNIDLTKFTWE